MSSEYSGDIRSASSFDKKRAESKPRAYSQSRTGHLFQGRYKALLIDADTYLLELVRYIYLNPVRAGIVAAADEYRR